MSNIEQDVKADAATLFRSLREFYPGLKAGTASVEPVALDLHRALSRWIVSAAGTPAEKEFVTGGPQS